VTHLLVFESAEERWRVFESSDNTDMSHEEMIDRATEIANAWFAGSLTDRIVTTEVTGSGS